MIDSCDGEFESVMGLTSDMEALLKSNRGDIAIVCGGKQIKVHSFLLGARSPVFARMLESGMKEQQDRVVELKDDNMDDIFRLLFYLYTGKVDKNDLDYGRLTQLLIVADKYEVLKLVLYIGSQIVISKENALELGILGGLHNSDILVKRSAEYIHAHMRECLSQEDWMKRIQESPKLMAEIIKITRENSNPRPSESNIRVVLSIVNNGSRAFKEGVHRNAIVDRARIYDMSDDEVCNVLDFLSSEGQIYSNIDENHFRITKKGERVLFK